MADYKVPTLESFSWQTPVENKDLTAPPVSISKGLRHIVASPATGDWSGHSLSIATYTGTAWEFISPIEGLVCWVKDENLFYKYDGSTWEPLVTAGGLFELDINGNLEPITDVAVDELYELDGSDDLMPKA